MIKIIFKQTPTKGWKVPYSPGKKENSRRRILDSAVRLFSAKGYQGVTLDELMQDADLTRGAFYAHFSSKKAIYREAVLHASRHGPVSHLTAVTETDAFKAMVRDYLHMAHVKQESPACPLAFLVTDVANQHDDLRTTYTEVYRDVVQRLAGLDVLREDRACLALSALLIGGVAVARALNDESLSQDVLDACYMASEALIRGSSGRGLGESGASGSNDVVDI